MKRSSLLLLIGALVMFQLNAHVELINPMGGEVFNPGEKVLIEWREVVNHNSLNWYLLFSGDGGSTWDTLEANIPIDVYSYQWVVPSITTQEGRIKIVQNNVSTDYEGTSPRFTITSLTGVIKPRKSNRIIAYPNPLVDFTMFEFENPGHESLTFKLYSSQGLLVRAINNITSDKVKVKRKNLASGTYVFILHDDKKILAQGKLGVN